MTPERLPPEAVSIRRAAELMQVSEDTIRRLLLGGHFVNAFRVGRQIRIPRSDLLAFKRANQVRRSQQG